MDQQLNYLGAAIFWSYIIAALFFTGLVIQTIASCIDRNYESFTKHKGDIAIFSTLACISFVTLSYNMLRVLIQSFLDWSSGFQSRPTLWALDINLILQWSLESTLFQDFAEGLVQTQSRLYWTQASLLATLSVCLSMGAEGYRKRVPRLWAFFCLSQILPISFTQNLFYVTLLSLPDTSTENEVPRRPITIVVIVYTAALLLVNRGTQGVLPIILTARVMLFTPLILYDPRWGDRKDTVRSTKGLEGRHLVPYQLICFAATAVLTFRREQLNIQDIGHALFDHPAVSSLGCDFILSTFSRAAWMLTSRWRNLPDKQADGKIQQM